MKAPKSAGKRVQWSVRLFGASYAMCANNSRAKTERLKRLWEKLNPTVRYELVKITTEPVVVETKKRKAK